MRTLTSVVMALWRCRPAQRLVGPARQAHQQVAGSVENDEVRPLHELWAAVRAHPDFAFGICFMHSDFYEGTPTNREVTLLEFLLRRYAHAAINPNDPNVAIHTRPTSGDGEPDRQEA